MEYEILNGIRMKEGIPHMFVIRPSGDCGWNPVHDNKIKLVAYQEHETEVELDAGNLLNNVDLTKLGSAFCNMPKLEQPDIDRISGSDHIDLSYTYINNLYIHGDFNNANFEHASIGHCRINDADFINSNFESAHMHSIECSESQFIHNNFTHAILINCEWKDTVMDSNHFSRCTFQQASFGRYAVIKDNSFYHTVFDNVDLNHADIRGENRNLDTIEFVMDTIPVEEREAAKSRQLKLLRSSADQNTELSDIPLREIDWNKVDVIYAYENSQKVPTDQRVTEWYGNYNLAVPKPGVSLMKFEERFEMAVYKEKWKNRTEGQGKTIEEAVENIMAEMEFSKLDLGMEM